KAIATLTRIYWTPPIAGSTMSQPRPGGLQASGRASQEWPARPVSRSVAARVRRMPEHVGRYVERVASGRARRSSTDISKLRFDLTRGLAAVALVLLAASLGCGPAAQPAAPAGKLAESPAAPLPAAQAAAAAPAGSSSASTSGQASGDQTWERVQAAARQEGKLIIGVPPGPQYEPALRETFGKAYPGIELEIVNLHTTPWSARVAKE